MKTGGKIVLALLVSCFSMVPLSEAALQIVGSVAAGPISGPIVANPNTHRVYESGGYAQTPATVYDVTNPAAPVLVTTVNGSGLSVNPNTNQYFTSTGYSSIIQTFDGATDTVIQTSPSSIYCGGMSDIDVTNNRLYMLNQCGGGNDPLQVYDPVTNTIIATVGSGGVANAPIFNSSNGYVYVVSSAGVQALDGTYAQKWTIPGRVAVGVNPLTNELFVAGTNGTGIDIYDGTAGTLVQNIPINPGQWIPTVAVNKTLNRLYIADQTNQLIHVVDGATHALLQDFSLGAGITPMGKVGIDEANSMVYVRGSDNMFYVLQDVPPSVKISPASGQLIATQNFDLALIVKAPGTTVVGVSATLDAVNITPTIKACVKPGTLLTGGSTFRCAGLNSGVRLGVGQHNLSVSMTLSDTSTVNDAVTWDVLGNTEP